VTIDARLTRLERLDGAGDQESVTIVHVAAEEGETWASVFTVDGEATPEAMEIRAGLEAEGYVVAPGYARPSAPRGG
jgi:hypothetical protein